MVTTHILWVLDHISSCLNFELISLAHGWHTHRHPHPSSQFSLFHFNIFHAAIIVFHPHWGDSGIRHRRYTAREKIAILSQIQCFNRFTPIFLSVNV